MFGKTQIKMFLSRLFQQRYQFKTNYQSTQNQTMPNIHTNLIELTSLYMNFMIIQMTQPKSKHKFMHQHLMFK